MKTATHKTTLRKVTAHDTLAPITRDDAKCANALRGQIATEVYYGMNLGIVLGHVHATDPELFAQIHTVFNLAYNHRQPAAQACHDCGSLATGPGA